MYVITVICKVKQCPFLSENGFCKNELLSITPNGQCGWIFDKNGMVKSEWRNPPIYQQKEKENDKE